MPSFLIFHHDTPYEVQYTSMRAGGETRYVISVNEKGFVIRNNSGVCEVLGNKRLNAGVLRYIGEKILEQEQSEIL